MTDIRTAVQQLQRPKMLIQAARLGLAEYRRDRDLRPFSHISLPPEETLPHLLQEEGRIEDCRKRGEMGYSIAQHIDILIALLGELRLLPKYPKASQS